MLSYWQVFRTGVIISLIVAVVILLAGGLHFLLHPQYASDMIKEAEESLAHSSLTAEEIARKREAIKAEYSFGMQMARPLIAQSIAGTPFSAILSFFFSVRK